MPRDGIKEYKMSIETMCGEKNQAHSDTKTRRWIQVNGD